MTYQDPDIVRDAMVDLVSGQLEPAEADALHRAIQSDPVLQDEYKELVVLVRHLHQYGDSLVADLPTVDLAESVAARIKDLTPESAGIVPFSVSRKPSRRVWWLATAAAAAVFLAVLWLGLSDRLPAGPRVAQDPTDRVAPVPGVAQRPVTPAGMPEEVIPAVPEARIGIAQGPQIDMDPPSVSEIMARRRMATQDEDAHEILARWAALAPEKARSVLHDPEASQEAIIGAALALSGEEARPYLAQAAAGDPTDPFLNVQLAEAGGAAINPELDQENALGWYIYARQLLADEPPDVDGALKALAKADSYEKAHAYALESAAYHEEALVASGMPADSARLLTAFTTGPDEYQNMVALGMDLLDYGEYFQQLGETQTAQTIVEAVQRFGEQLNTGAFFSHEQFAALEIQDAALQVLETIYTGDHVQTLTQDMRAVAAGLNGLVAFISNMNEFFAQNLGDQMWQTVADIILQRGDLQIFNGLPPVQP